MISMLLRSKLKLGGIELNTQFRIRFVLALVAMFVILISTAEAARFYQGRCRHPIHSSEPNGYAAGSYDHDKTVAQNWVNNHKRNNPE